MAEQTSSTILPASQASWIPKDMKCVTFKLDLYHEIEGQPQLYEIVKLLAGLPLGVFIVEGDVRTGRRMLGSLVSAVQLSQGRIVSVMGERQGDLVYIQHQMAKFVAPSEALIVYLEPVNNEKDIIMKTWGVIVASGDEETEAFFGYTLAGIVCEMAGLRPASNMKIAALGREHSKLKELLAIPSHSRTQEDSAQLSKCIDAAFDSIIDVADMLISELMIDNRTNRLLKIFNDRADILFIPNADEMMTQTMAAIGVGEKPCMMTANPYKNHRRGYGEVANRVTEILKEDLDIESGQVDDLFSGWEDDDVAWLTEVNEFCQPYYEGFREE
jgi:hypothetical protein